MKVKLVYVLALLLCTASFASPNECARPFRCKGHCPAQTAAQPAVTEAALTNHFFTPILRLLYI